MTVYVVYLYKYEHPPRNLPKELPASGAPLTNIATNQITYKDLKWGDTPKTEPCFYEVAALSTCPKAGGVDPRFGV